MNLQLYKVVTLGRDYHVLAESPQAAQDIVIGAVSLNDNYNKNYRFTRVISITLLALVCESTDTSYYDYSDIDKILIDYKK